MYNVIESIDKGSIAARNGKLQVGDTLVSVNGMATEGRGVAARIVEPGRNVESVAMRKDSSRRSSIFGSGRRSSKSEAAADASPEIGGAGGAVGRDVGLARPALRPTDSADAEEHRHAPLQRWSRQHGDVLLAMAGMGCGHGRRRGSPAAGGGGRTAA